MVGWVHTCVCMCFLGAGLPAQNAAVAFAPKAPAGSDGDDDDDPDSYFERRVLKPLPPSLQVQALMAGGAGRRCMHDHI